MLAYPLSPMAMFVVSAMVMVLATIGGVPHPIIARPVHPAAESHFQDCITIVPLFVWM